MKINTFLIYHHISIDSTSPKRYDVNNNIIFCKLPYNQSFTKLPKLTKKFIALSRNIDITSINIKKYTIKLAESNSKNSDLVKQNHLYYSAKTPQKDNMLTSMKNQVMNTTHKYSIISMTLHTISQRHSFQKSPPLALLTTYDEKHQSIINTKIYFFPIYFAPSFIFLPMNECKSLHIRIFLPCRYI